MNQPPSYARLAAVGLLGCSLVSSCAHHDRNTSRNTDNKPGNGTPFPSNATLRVITAGAVPFYFDTNDVLTALPAVRILPEDIVQDSIQRFPFPYGTNNFTVRWTYTEPGARKMLAFWREHAGEKVLTQVGDFEFRATIFRAATFPAKPPIWTEEGWLKTRTDKFFGVSEADASFIVAGLKSR